MTFKDLAIPMAMMQVPVIRLNPRSKIPIDRAWQELATTEVGTILAWDKETPNANCGCVAKEDGFLFFETDESGVIERYEKETKQKFPRTFTVASRPGRFHFYFRQSVGSKKMGQISQKVLGFGSVRQDNAFVVSAGSTHPDTGLPYTLVDSAPIVEMPDPLILWLLAQRKEAPKTQVSVDGPIIEGSRNATLASLGGRLRRDGLEQNEIESILLRVNAERCKPPLPESEVKTIAWSVSRYPTDIAPKLTINGVVPGAVAVPVAQPGVLEIAPEDLTRAADEVGDEYPLWCWNGTLYEEFADLCGEGNLIPKEFFIESVKTFIGAICGHRILPYKSPQQEARFYTVLLSKIGGTGKSTAMSWAEQLFLGTGLVYPMTQEGSGFYQNVGCAIGGFASSSGLVVNGFALHDRILQKYDEMSSLIEKFSITGSGDAFLDAENQLYEKGYPPTHATRKSTAKEMPNRYVHNSIIGGSTFDKWRAAFAKTSSEGSGFFQRLNVVPSVSIETVPELLEPDFSVIRERFVKKIQPLEFRTAEVTKTPGALSLLDAWDKRRIKEWKDYPADITGRLQVLIQRNISHLAWLLNEPAFVPGSESLDGPISIVCTEDVMERAIALTQYQLGARQMHRPSVGNNEWALVEDLIRNCVRKHRKISRISLQQEIRSDKFGLKTFNCAIDNLVKEGVLDTGQIKGNTQKGLQNQVIVWTGE